MTDPDENSLGELTTELEALRRSLAKLRTGSTFGSEGIASRAQAWEQAQEQGNKLRTIARLLQNDLAEYRSRLELAQREAWDQKVRRADATAKLRARERLLQQIQRSAVWKAVKPVWKLFNRSARNVHAAPENAELAFALDLPKHWRTKREILLVKGWCFSRSGKEIAGVRARIAGRSRLARYGFERLDVAGSFPDYPAARHSGFTVELRLPAGRSRVRLETIEQGSDWKCFFEHDLERDAAAESENGLDDVSGEEKSPERILRLPPLSAAKALGLLQAQLRQHARRVSTAGPFLSVITPVYNSKPEWLAEAALSLLNQTFPDWEWCLIDDGSHHRETKKLLELLKGVSPRLRVDFGSKSGISATTNRGLDLARGEYVCFLDHDDLLHPLAFQAMAEKLSEGFDVVYSDEDKLDHDTGNLVEPFFKPDWSPEYFRGAMYVGHLLCVRRELAARTRFDSAFDGVQDFEFMLRLSEAAPRIGHIPQILYHWRKTPGSIAARTDAKPEIDALQQRAVNAHLDRIKLPARAERSSLPHRLKLVPAKDEIHSRVSVIIPTRDAPDVLGRCLRSIFDKTSHRNYEVILIDNESTDERALALMTQYPVRRIDYPNPFNFSRANNVAAHAATGELLLFLNNDTEVISEDWLQHLSYYAEQADVGAAGALLAYEDRTVQHAGVALGMRGTADHTMRRFPIDVDGYAGSLVCAREVSGVTAACLMIRKSLFDDVGGFNPHFFTAYQDVDLCLCLRQRGLRVICTPRALLLHHESVSRQNYYDMIDRILLLDRWEETIQRGDPYYNPNLDLERGDYSPRRLA